MSDRKYRQRGYMDSDRESQRPKPQSNPQSKPLSNQDREGPRSPRMMAYGETVKCDACGEKAPSNITLDSSCSKCNADLHTCRQCTYFDPGARFETADRDRGVVARRRQAAHQLEWERDTHADTTSGLAGRVVI